MRRPLTVRRVLPWAGGLVLLLLIYLRVDGLDRMRGIARGRILAPELTAEDFLACRIVTRAPISGEDVVTESRDGLTWYVVPVDKHGGFRFKIEGERKEVPIACVGAGVISPADRRISAGWSLPLPLRRLYWCQIEVTDADSGDPAQTRLREEKRVTDYLISMEPWDFAASDLALDYLGAPRPGLSDSEGAVSFLYTRDLDENLGVELGLALGIGGYLSAEWAATVQPATAGPFIDEVQLQRSRPVRRAEVQFTWDADLGEYQGYTRRSFAMLMVNPLHSGNPRFIASEVELFDGAPLTLELPEGVDYRMYVRLRNAIFAPGEARHPSSGDLEFPLPEPGPAEPFIVDLGQVGSLVFPPRRDRIGEHGLVMIRSGYSTQPFSCRYAAERGLILDGFVPGRHDLLYMVGEEEPLGEIDVDVPFPSIQVAPGANVFPFE